MQWHDEHPTKMHMEQHYIDMPVEDQEDRNICINDNETTTYRSLNGFGNDQILKLIYRLVRVLANAPHTEIN